MSIITLQGSLLAASSAAPTDPYWANVVSLLHFDSTPGAALVDQKGKTWTKVSAVDTSATQVKFGPRSLAVSNSTVSSRIESADALGVGGFGTGDFTIEGWAYRNGNGRGIFHNALTSSSAGIALAHNLAGQLQIYNNGAVVNSASGILPDLAWSYLAMVRNGSSLVVYLNGTAVITTTTAVNITGSGFVYAGYYNTNFAWNGYLDEWRITKGVARYTSAFTPPSAAFPDS